jgi:hypothetical protein
MNGWVIFLLIGLVVFVALVAELIVFVLVWHNDGFKAAVSNIFAKE